MARTKIIIELSQKKCVPRENKSALCGSYGGESTVVGAIASSASFILQGICRLTICARERILWRLFLRVKNHDFPRNKIREMVSEAPEQRRLDADDNRVIRCTKGCLLRRR